MLSFACYAFECIVQNITHYAQFYAYVILSIPTTFIIWATLLEFIHT